MGSAIHAFEQNSIDHSTERRNVINNFDVPLVSQFCCKRIDTSAAVFNIRTSSLEGGDHTNSRDVLWVGGVVEDSREDDNMRSVESDDSHTERLGRFHLSEADRDQERDHGKQQRDTTR